MTTGSQVASGKTLVAHLCPSVIVLALVGAANHVMAQKPALVQLHLHRTHLRLGFNKRGKKPGQMIFLAREKWCLL
jgi:hypothetical protein